MTLDCAFTAETEEEALRLAREWADAEPLWTFVGIIRAVQPYMPERPHWWEITVALESVTDPQPSLWDAA